MREAVKTGVRLALLPGLALFWVALSLLRAIPGNPARHAMRPVVAQLRPLRPRFLARHGDAGIGFDNRTPWFTRYLVVADAPDLGATVLAAAARAGYQRDPNARPSTADSDPAWTCHALTSGGRKLRIGIARDADVPVRSYGRGITWGDTFAAREGRALLRLSIALPASIR
ncbi:hypothetical protein SAMN05192558_101170 [Actinokineospora alba]|uniref:Uncharacterized protein n=1 Tax=Actinokineospora alba TaxID=504798 RepID=A0A1H0F006_9PSEU|nr:hypothetical protein [Actinokineospora alba]TDP69291.1 hypothetical protein C8E96_4867 [Actinokineospora alba]SDI20073.1 hypothetical protein SAMN05421871_103699 [Actinokineospora alba]SDN87972.1 hypothetical protein SAMN05192558_101170 [Actinokineospora alba]